MLAFLAWWHFSRLVPRAAPAGSDPPQVLAAAHVVTASHTIRNPHPAIPLQSSLNTQPVSPPAPSAFTDFSRWAEQFLAGETSASAARGAALAWKRREAMVELIRSDPQKALALTVPFGWRSALPASVSRLFEQQVDGRGALDVAMAEDVEHSNERMLRWARVNGQKYEAFVYGRRLRQGCQVQIPLHGIVLDGKMAVSVEPIRLLGPGEAGALAKARGQALSQNCGVCGAAVNLGQQGLAADIGGELACFCGPAHAQLVTQHSVMAEDSSGGGVRPLVATDQSADNDSWTHGEKSLLYMRLNFPDDLTEPVSEADAYNQMVGVNAFYAEGSYDQTWLTATVTPLLTLPQIKAWYSTAGVGALLDDARAVARLAEYDTANYAFDIACFTSVPGKDFSGWAGLAYVHGKGVWLQSTGVGVTAHELGHNYGLMHANFWDTSMNNFTLGTGLGTNTEYGNPYDTMGAASAGNNQFSSMFKNFLDWLPNTAVADVSTNGVYRIYPFDVPSREPGRFYAATVRKDYQRDYWVEFRQKFTYNPWLQYGVLLNWSPFDQSKGGSDLIDTTPGTPQGRTDAAVVVGRTFSDRQAGVHITPLERGATGTNIWMDVQVNLGGFPDNQPPVLQVEVSPTNATPDMLVHFHATASDPDGDTLAYAWTFDDATFSTNNLPWTFKSFPAGEHVVRCVVSDMKGGVASANAVVTVGEPTGSRITGVVRDPNGAPVEGVRVDNSPDTNASTYVGGYTDSDGRYVITGVSGDINLYAFNYGYVLTNLTWANPITASSNILAADFIAIPLTTVSIAVTTNQVPETSTATNYFILTRTGDTTTNLTVNLNLSGSAAVGVDFKLNPALASGTNSIDIPPGTNALWVAFRTIKDSLVRGPQTATLTIADDLTNVVGSLGEATITILDDDAPSRSAVSVVATTPSISENGTDLSQFVFSRDGSTQTPLTVFYSVSGTAVPGANYTSLLGVVVIPAGQSSAVAQFQPLDDRNVGPDTTVIVTLSANAAYTIGGSPAQVTILNDNLTTVTIFPTGADAAEPSTPGRFTVKRDGDLNPDLVVYYNVSGTATSGLDYVPLSGSVILPAGASSADIVLTPLDDNLLEGDESVILALTNNASYNVGTPGSATLFIHDKSKPSITITTTADTASEPGDQFGTFQISRGSVKNGNLTVYLAISGTAMNGIDYVPIDNTVVIPDGSSSVSVDIIAFDDLILEPIEDVILTLLANTNYNLGSPLQARVMILDDDANSVPGVGFTFSTSSAPESQSPGISVSLSQTSSVPITVNYRVVGGTASTNDYTLPPGPMTFDPGELAKSLPLTIKDNSIPQPNRTIRLALYDPINATLDGIKIHTYTILDDDTNAVSITATTASGSETGPAAGNFRISRTGSTAAPLLVNFQVTGTASAPTDYAPLGTSVILPASAAFVDLPVLPVDDRTVELPETVVVTLISASGSRIVSPSVATVTINDNDPNSLPVVTVTSTNHPYAVEGGSNGEFVFWRSTTAGPLTLYFSLGGTGRGGLDYVALPDSITIPDGQVSVSVPVQAIDDTLVEGERTVVADLTVLGTYRVSYTASAIVTIQDNDQRVRIDASDFTAAEPGTDRGEFTFTRFGTTNADVRVFYSISGTAGNGVDYVAISNSIIIPTGSLFATLPIIVIDDTLVEGPETVTLTLQSAPAYFVDTPSSATVIINDDEPMLTITATVPEVVEGSQTPGVLTVTRSGDPKYTFTAYLAVGGTATYGVDYPPFLTNIYFSYGVTSIDLLISPTNELVIEGPETVTAMLLPDPAYSILSPSNALVTILDAGTNLAPAVNITSPTANVVFLLGSNVNMILEAMVMDDGDTNALTYWWSKVSGPDSLAFGDTNQASTTVSFTNAGIYVLRLTADDGQLQSFAEVTAVVGAVELLSTNSLHWSFDEGSGTNVFDSSGAGNNGVLAGNPAWVTNGVLGGALSFAGGNDSVRGTNATSSLDGLPAFSLSLWVKQTGTNADQGIFTAADSGTNVTLSLSSKNVASYGQYTNVIEATVATTRGFVRRISANNIATNAWQHLLLTWSNGVAPALFINGQLDQPMAHMVALGGVLTNCPQFVVGKGPPDWLLSWNGHIDDVRLFPRLLTAGEAAALASLPPTNCAAVVDAGTNFTLQLNTPGTLAGLITDDGRPVPPGTVVATWTNLSGPVPVTITNVNSLTNTIPFTDPGEYVFRLIADDGQVKTYSDITLTVIEPTRVDVFASDPEAAELGPDTGTFTFTRNGDTSFDLPVFLSIGGIASNGVDYVEVTNAIVFPAGTDTVEIVITPYLDHRTEGDETVIFTIITNLAYSIGNGEATVTIHDSPYGVWTIGHFTLEELTDPSLSGEGADFDHDGLVNLAEYAANRDPKTPETNAPLVMTIELDPTDQQRYVMLTYPRRIEPTDVSYAVAVSSDLVTWQTGTNYVTELQAIPDGNNLTETVTARLVAPFSTSTNQFITVRVWLRATRP